MKTENKGTVVVKVVRVARLYNMSGYEGLGVNVFILFTLKFRYCTS